MVDKKEKPEAAAKAPKKAPAAKAPVAKQQTAPAKEKKAPAAKSSGHLTVTQTGSPIGRQNTQRATLIGLGLNKVNRTRTLEDTPSVRGMIEKVKHLVKVVK